MTSALITALSRLLIVSNTNNPRTTRIIERTSNIRPWRNILPLFIVEVSGLAGRDLNTNSLLMNIEPFNY
jgi:hypothetical protein